MLECCAACGPGTTQALQALALSAHSPALRTLDELRCSVRMCHPCEILPLGSVGQRCMHAGCTNCCVDAHDPATLLLVNVAFSWLVLLVMHVTVHTLFSPASRQSDGVLPVEVSPSCRCADQSELLQGYGVSLVLGLCGAPQKRPQKCYEPANGHASKGHASKEHRSPAPHTHTT